MGAVMYGTGIQEAIAKGDLRKMKALLRQAQDHLKEYGDIPTAVEVLKVEIAKLEAQHKRSK